MFKTFFLSELKYVLKRPMVYIFFGLMALLTFAATASERFIIGAALGNVYKNAPRYMETYKENVRNIERNTGQPATF